MWRLYRHQAQADLQRFIDLIHLCRVQTTNKSFEAPFIYRPDLIELYTRLPVSSSNSLLK